MMSANEKILNDLLALRDEHYGDFHASLLPDTPRNRIIGIRIPALRAYAKQLAEDTATVEEFVGTLPHTYLDEYTLHALLIARECDFGKAMSECERLLPYIDNWAVCDIFSPRAFGFAKHHDALYEKCLQWLDSERTYTVRFGIVTLMRHFLDTDFRPEALDHVARLRTEEYYINMAVAWFFCDALIKQWDAALPYLTDYRLAPWTHNKAIRKCIESFRIAPERKQYLRTLTRTQKKR